MDNGKTAFGEDGSAVNSVEFDYESIEPFDVSDCSQEDIDRAIQLFTALVEWIWQRGMKNGDGIQIRSILACWIFLKHVRPLTMSELARGFGKDKQSLGRWHDHFKVKFPFIQTSHMR